MCHAIGAWHNNLVASRVILIAGDVECRGTWLLKNPASFNRLLGIP